MGKKDTNQAESPDTHTHAAGTLPAKPEKPLGEKAKARLEAFKRRRNDRPPIFTQEKAGSNEIQTTRENFAQISSLLNTTEACQINNLTAQLASVARPELAPIDAHNTGVAFLHELDPHSAIETLLCSQMIGTHNATMEYTRRALHTPAQAASAKAASIAVKCGALFTRQVELLLKLRGQGGKQTVRVEHVTVQPGGQAIVGNVATGGEGGTRRG